MHTAVDHNPVPPNVSVMAPAVSLQPALPNPQLPKILARGADKIASMMQNERRVARGAALTTVNAGHDCIYQVRSGWLGETRALSDGRAHYIHIYLAGDLCPLSVLLRSHRSDRVSAFSNAVVGSVQRRDLLRAVLEDSDISARCLWEMSEQEGRLEHWVVSLAQRTAEERLCALLIELWARLTTAGCVPASCCSFEMPLTQMQLAMYLGLTPVHINRVLKSLRHRQVVEIRGGKVALLDPEALRRRANL